MNYTFPATHHLYRNKSCYTVVIIACRIPSCCCLSGGLLFMGMTNDGLSYWQAETSGEPLLEITIGDLLDRRAGELPTRKPLSILVIPSLAGCSTFAGVTRSIVRVPMPSPRGCWHS